MTDAQLREIVADSLPHDNKEFIRQVREGEQDDGPYIRGAAALMNYINENYSLLPLPELINDE
jgi:hypothetical protein